MSFELPTGKVKAERVNPKTMVLFSKPKIGKTTALSQLENCLLIDVEDGSQFVDAIKVNVLNEAKKQNISPIAAIKQLIDKLKKANEAKGDFVYKYGVVDTVSALEDHCLLLANKMYRDTPQGRNWQGDDVTTLPNGAGYQHTRKALSMVLDEMAECFDTFIISGHVKDKLVEKEGKEMNERGLNLIGKSASILCSQVDAVGYVYREDNKTIVNFTPSETLIAGSRSEHLKNQKITLIESDDKGNLNVDWSKIFIKD